MITDDFENLVSALSDQERVAAEDEERLVTLAQKVTINDKDLVEEKEVAVKTAEPNENDIRQRLADMKLSDKVKLALLGNSVARGLLVFDSNKLIQRCLFKNPRLTLPEVENFSKCTSLDKNVLRLISDSKEWMRYYSVKLNITSNPKTPGDVGIKWLRFINEPELRKLAKSKQVPQLIANTAKKRVIAMDEK